MASLSSGKQAAPTFPPARPPVAGIVQEWAKTLVPQNAPKAADKGPLAWVRETKVAELIAALAKAGYR